MCFIWFTNCYSAAVCDRYSLSLLRAIHKSNTVIPFRMYVQSSVFVCNNKDFSLVSFAFCPFGRSVKEFHVSVSITLVIRLLWGNANLSQGWMNVSVTGHQPMMKLASAFVLHTFKVGLWFVNKHRRRRRRKKRDIADVSLVSLDVCSLHLVLRCASTVGQEHYLTSYRYPPWEAGIYRYQLVEKHIVHP